MNAVELIKQDVAPIVEKIYAEVSALDFNKVKDEVHHESEWVLHIREAFHKVNRAQLEEVAGVVQSEKYRGDIEAVGKKCRENMGEEMFKVYQTKNGIKTVKDLGESLVMDNVLCSIIQKVHNFSEIDHSLTATVVENKREELDRMRDDITKLVMVATKVIIEETRGKIDYFDLDLISFLFKFADNADEGTVEGNAVEKAFDAITDMEESADILSHMITESGIDPVEVFLNSEKVIAEAIQSQVHLAVGVTYLWNKRGASEELTLEYMNERINKVLLSLSNS